MRVKVKSQLGLVLIVISSLLWATVIAVPFLPAATAQKATITASLFIVSEVSFWLGILLTGKEAQRYRHKLSPYYWWQRITNNK